MSSPVFRHGVASGDPLPDGILLWTRVDAPVSAPVAVSWRVATDPALARVCGEGVVETGPEQDWTVHADVRGLEPAGTYYFGFRACGQTSRVGRTRTAPAGRLDHARLGLVACASWAGGFFNAYAHLAARDVDLVVHVGDYLYAQDGQDDGAVRAHDPPDAPLDLDGYRRRHAQYKTDPDLQRLHARHPMVAVWDDHEIAGDAWRGGAGAHDPQRDGDWRQRRDAAVRAYLEWMPVRAEPGGEVPRIYRTVRLGDLVDLVMLDTRLVGRDEPAATGPVPTPGDHERSLLGDEQRRWLAEQLTSSVACWRLLGNQVVLAPLHALRLPGPLRSAGRRLGAVAGGVFVNPGQWDGYPGERRWLLELLAGEHVRNVVVLTGDIHSSWAGELLPCDDAPPVAVELVTPSVSSQTFAEKLFPPVPGAAPVLTRLVRRQNPHMRFAKTTGHGYVIVDVTRKRVQADWWHVDTVRRRSSGERHVVGWQVRDREAHLRPAPRPTRPRRQRRPMPMP